MANDAVIEKLHLLDIEEDQLLQALQLIREQRTAVLESLDRVSTTEVRPVTIHSLPPELLTKIFEAACLATIDFGSDDEEYSDLTGVPNIVLSQVCHTWRQLAVQTSSLWTRLDLSSPRLVTDCDILRRSGQRMLTVSRTPVIDHFSWSRSLPVLSDIISKTYPRWASLLWYFRTESEVKWLFQLMFEADEVQSSLRSVYLFCRSRQYGRFSLSIPGQYFVRNPSSWSRPLAQFPFLERVFIHDILLTELSPAMFSSALRQLSIGSSFMTTYTDLGFSVSRLCYLLRPATGLEEISLIGCIPDWDVCLDISQRSPSHKIDREALMPTHRGHNIVIPALYLHNLRVLDWDSAPYKDFPRILHLFGCNRLESLTLQLVVQKKQLWRMEPWCTQIVDRQFSLPYLHTLSVSTLDSQLFTGALKNLDCLDLNVLVIRCGLGGLATRAEEISSQHAQRTLSNFPPSDSLFHEPRMTRSLKQFEIFGANIDPMKLRAVMMYMPSLESLSLEKCTGKYFQYADRVRVLTDGRGHIPTRSRQVCLLVIGGDGMS